MMSVEIPPAVSVVVIFLNPGAGFLGEAIDSVRAQTFTDWELILVDDGSTDDSSALARSAAAAAPDRIRYLEHPNHENRGMSASRNRGIEAARGRYLAFLDADDVYLPERLAHHVAILDANPEVAMVYGPYVIWLSWRHGAAAADRVSNLGLATESVHAPPHVLEGFISSSGHNLPGICSLTARTAAVRQVGGFEATFRGCYEDQVFLAKITARFPVYVTAACLDRYRQHEQSCTAEAARSGEYDPYGLPHPARERFLRWLDDYLPTTGIRSPVLRQAVAMELWPYEHPRLYAVFVMPLKLIKRSLKAIKQSMLNSRAGSRVSLFR
jgi:glycosyltransferase involved in cell wall biosynthesis